MRQIFFSLLGLNVLIFLWGFFLVDRDAGRIDSVAEASSSAAVPVYDRPLDSVPELSVSDAGAVEAPNTDLAASGGGAAIEAKASPAASELCDIVGPFAGESEASDFMERLRAIDINSSLHELELATGQNYWVYLKPEASRREAMKKLAELQAQGIDSYVIPRGEMANGISLGMFTQKKLAEQHLNDMLRKGLSPLLQIVERTQMEIWVMISQQDAEKMSKITWQRLMDDQQEQERRQNLCLGVAL